MLRYGPRLLAYLGLMNQGLDLLVGRLAGLIGLQDDAEDLAQLLPAPWNDAGGTVRAGHVLLQLLQQGLHGQREAADVAPRAVAVPCHVGLLIEDRVAGLLPVFALHGHQDQAR